MKKFLGAVVIFGLVMAPAFAVQTGGAGASNPEVVKGAFTAEAHASSQTLEVTTGITKFGAPTYTWPAALGPTNSYLKNSGTGTLTWEVISGTSAAGETGQIQFNSSNNFAANANLTWDASANNKLFVTGTVEATYFRGDGRQLTDVRATSATTAETAGSATPSGAAGGDLTGTYPNPTITAEAITGPKLANQVIKAGSLDDAAYSIILSNEGTGEESMSSTFIMKNSAGALSMVLVSQTVPEEGGIAGIQATKYLMMNSPGIQIETDELELRGTIKTTDIPPSLYVKTTADQKLTAEALSLAGAALDEGKILIGDASNVAAANTVSGDITMTSTGVTTIAAGAVATDEIADGSITSQKLADTLVIPVGSGGTGISTVPTASQILVGDNGTDSYSLRILSGDVTMNYTGTTTIAANRITTTMLKSDFLLPVSKGGTNLSSVPFNGQVLVGYAESYYLRTLTGDVTMDYAGTTTIAAGRITADKLASNFTLPVDRGGTGATIYPTGEIVFGNGINPLQSDSQLNWDNTNKTVVVGQIPDFVGGTGFGFFAGADDPVTLGGIAAGDGNDSALILAATRGTLASPTPLLESDPIGGIIFAGYDGNEGQGAAYISSQATQNWGVGANGGSLSLVAVNNDDGGATAIGLDNGEILAMGNLGVLGSTSVATTLEVAGSVIYTPNGDHVISTSGIGSELLGSKVLLIKGDSALTDVSANPQIAAGSDGQMLVLIGRDDTALVKFNNGNGLQLSAATSFTMGIGDVLQLIYVNSISKWVEISRTDN